MNPQEPMRTPEQPLESWKEIAGYLQRDVSTTQRWEKNEGLPVHRHSHKSRSSVYAYPSEIDAWRAGRRVTAEPEAAPARPWWRPLWATVAAALCLVMVGNGLHPQAASAQGLTVRQIPIEAWASLSPDGRFMAVVEYNGANNALVVQEIDGSQRRVLQTGVCMGKPCAEPDFPLLSPDLKQVAYNWWDDRVSSKTSQLRVIANEPGAQPRTLVRDYTYFEPAAFAPDGKSILVVLDLADKKAQQIAWVNAADGAVAVLKAFPTGASQPNLSADGKYIAYSVRTGSASQVYVLSSDGKIETAITKGASSSEAPSWTPDGKHILYTSNQAGQFDLYSIEVRDGKPVGIANVVKRNIGSITAVGTTSSGTFLYRVQRSDTFDTVAELKQSGGSLTLNATEKFAGGMPAWSPDGKWIAFKRVRPGQQNYDLVVRSVATGEERLYSHERIMFPAAPNWLRDGKGLILPIASEKGETSFYRVDLASGRFTEVVPPDPLHGPFARLSPDDRVLFINTRRRLEDGVVDHVSSYNLKSRKRGADIQLNASGLSFWFSPDGRRIGFGSRGQDGKFHYGVANADGSGYREIYAMSTEFPRQIVCWGPDGQSLLFGKGESEKETLIMRVPLEGGEPQSTGLRVSSDVQAMVPAGDGSHVALFGRGYVGELWALDNVLSAVK